MSKNRDLFGSNEVHYRIARHYETGKAVAVCVQWHDYHDYTFLNTDCYKTEEKAEKAVNKLNGVITTLDALVGLPNETLIRDKFGDVGIIFNGSIWSPETAALPLTYAHRYLPMVVLRRGKDA